MINFKPKKLNNERQEAIRLRSHVEGRPCWNHCGEPPQATRHSLRQLWEEDGISPSSLSIKVLSHTYQGMVSHGYKCSLGPATGRWLRPCQVQVETAPDGCWIFYCHAAAPKWTPQINWADSPGAHISVTHTRALLSMISRLLSRVGRVNDKCLALASLSAALNPSSNRPCNRTKA